MHSLRIILAAGACVTVGALFGPAFATATAEKVKEVIVTNEDPIPVDLKGSPTVTVGNTPSVRVDNVPAVAEAGTPVQIRMQMSLQPSTSFGASEPYAVPAGKVLRIDHVSFHDGNREAEVEGLSLITRLGGENISHPVLVHRQGPDGDAASQPIRAYADDPSAAVRFFVSLDQALSSTATHNLFATFTGVLLDE